VCLARSSCDATHRLDCGQSHCATVGSQGKRLDEGDQSDRIPHEIHGGKRIFTVPMGQPWKRNEVQGEIVVRSEAFAKQNLARIKIFFETSSPDGTRGLSQSQVVDLILLQRVWGTVGAGVTAQLTEQTSDHLGGIALGPAVAAVVERENGGTASSTRTFSATTPKQ
jgi:hypothetical protein